MRRLEAESLKNCPRSSAGQSPAFLGALSNLDEFLLNPQIPTHSGTVPGTFLITNLENQDQNEDRSQDAPHPEMGPCVYQSRHSDDSDPDEAPHMVTGIKEEIRYCPHIVTGAQEEIRIRHHMVTGVQEKIRNCHHMVTRVQEEISYCSTETSSEKQKKARSTV